MQIGVILFEGCATLPPLCRYIDEIGIGGKALAKPWHVVPIPGIGKASKCGGRRVLCIAIRRSEKKSGNNYQIQATHRPLRVWDT
jgi:hypothetical protein